MPHTLAVRPLAFGCQSITLATEDEESVRTLGEVSSRATPERGSFEYLK
jgi:hypothetical protein